jgi:hypothetical protein
MRALALGGVAGHQQDHHRRMTLARFEHACNAVELGHHDVGQQQIERASPASEASAAMPSPAGVTAWPC